MFTIDKNKILLNNLKLNYHEPIYRLIVLQTIYFLPG
jgi:hypothetical protein